MVERTNKIDVMPTNNIRRQAEHPKKRLRGYLRGVVSYVAKPLTRGRGT